MYFVPHKGPCSLSFSTSTPVYRQIMAYATPNDKSVTKEYAFTSTPHTPPSGAPIYVSRMLNPFLFLLSPSIHKAKSHGLYEFQNRAWQGDHIVSLSVLLQTHAGYHRGVRTITHLGRTSKASVSLLIMLEPRVFLCGRHLPSLGAVLDFSMRTYPPS